MNKRFLVFGAIAALAALSSPSVKLTEDQEYFLSILHPAAKAKFRKFTINAERMGWQVIFTSTYRTFAKQAQLKAQNSLNASPGRSYHNYGMAIDLNLRKDGVQIRKADSIALWESTGVPQMGEAMGFTWGGRFANYHDPVHFDMRSTFGDTLTLYNKAIAQFGTNWSDIQGNKLIL
jgi:hypothetical protein